ncbi:CRAL-TRIO domain-containing protein [Calycina marina]|uniref:CRAL-TRIO domain-containing protein n=1 Tax=Calycina marina TaxID=1763456 RepID=A0A9P7Z9E3_9HELO|nr:CRAL-TRIO domain-containing protein [Calycina marina]
MSGPAHRVQSAVEEYGYPQGHLGHLTVDQEAALQNFKVKCAEAGYYAPAADTIESSYDDATLLRFLRARRFVVLDAFKQFQDTEVWRKANKLEELYNTIDLEHYEETRQLYPQWTGRRDRRGIPVYVYEVRHLNAKTMSAYEKSASKTKSKVDIETTYTTPKMLRLFALYENLTRFVMPLCTALTDRDHPRTPITQSNNIVDISGVGLKQFWNLRGHMQDASTLATAHYPETLDRIFIIGAPSFFPTVWGWIKKWFDPITTSKIFILSSHDMKATLESFIDPINIPIKYGGSLPFKFGQMPTLDPALSKLLEWEGGNKEFPKGPMYWVPKGTGKMEALAVGSKEEMRREEVCVLTRTMEEDKAVANGRVVGEGDKLDLQPPGLPKHLLEADTVPTTPASEKQNALTAIPAEEELVQKTE